jgi:hypothetical protein
MKCAWCGGEHSGPQWEQLGRLIADLGETVVVRVLGQGAWRVPRTYIACKGLRGEELGVLADKHGWQAVGEDRHEGDGEAEPVRMTPSKRES